MRRRAAALLQSLGESINLDVPLRQLPLAQRQMVSMARALVGNCRLVIMDEPTASLSARETDVLFQLIHRLRDEGISVLYVSHRLEEIFSIADRITVLRDGRVVETRPVSQMNRETLIELMVGRQLQAATIRSRPTAAVSTRAPLLQVRRLTRIGVFQDVSLNIERRRSVGHWRGLAMSVPGAQEVARAIFGIDPYDNGEVNVNGTAFDRRQRSRQFAGWVSSGTRRSSARRIDSAACRFERTFRWPSCSCRADLAAFRSVARMTDCRPAIVGR